MSQVSIETIHHLFDVMPMGVVMMDRDSRVVFYNRYEEQLAGRSRQQVLGQAFFSEVAPCTEVSGLGGYYHENIGHKELRRHLMFHFPRPCIERPRDVRLVLSSVEVERKPYGLLFVEDVSPIRAVERTKDFLVRMLAHDMNNPLTAIGSAMGLIEPGEPPTRTSELLQAAGASLTRLQDMVRNLYELTRLHTSQVPLEFSPHDVGQVAGEALDQCRPMARSAGVILESRLPEGALIVEIDRDLLRRAILNLLDNAIRFSGEGKQVSLEVSRDGDRVVIEVRDQGPGIPEALRELVFQPFSRGPRDAFVDPKEHRGLGLAFVDLVAREHQGNVALHCPERGGTVLTLSLPLAQTRRDLRG